MKPCPSSPRQLVIGTRTSLKKSSEVSASSCPILSRLRPRSKPSRSASTRTIDTPRSEEHTSELQSLMRISYAVFCLKKKTKKINKQDNKEQHYVTTKTK